MPKREKFGKFVLLEEVDTSGLGSEYRAAKLGPMGFEKLVSLLRLSSTISGSDVAKQLMEQAKVAALLQNPNIIKILGIGNVPSYYISYEFIEGKNLKAILARGRQEGFPFSVDHALLIASKICAALEYAHSRKTEGGTYFHGFVNPAAVLVSYEGEVRIGGFGYWPSHIREAGAVTETEAAYLAPEQASGGTGDPRSDAFGVGAVLFEVLTGHRLFEGGRTSDINSRLTGARLQSPTGDDDSLPKAISEILSRSLALDPARRYGQVQEMRKAIDTLLFSGDFTPTTFNLAFFMHSLFREDIEKESRQLKEDKEGSYLEFLDGDALKTAAIPKMATPLPGSIPAPRAEEPRHTPPREPPREATPTPPSRETRTPVPVSAPPHHEEPAPGLSSKEAAAGFTFHKEEATRKLPVIPALAAVLLLAAAGGGYYYFGQQRVSEAAAAQARVRDLELKLKKMEEEKAAAEQRAEEERVAAEQKAKEEATTKIQKEAKAKGAEVDPAALQRAQEEAARKARAEQEKKQEEERRRAEEQKKAEEARLEEERRKAAELAAATPPPPPTTAPPPATVPAVRPGAFVKIDDPGVISPITEKAPPPVYPPIALRQRVEGPVELRVLVDEKGNVVDANVVSAPAGNAGLGEAALEGVKRWKYRPATLEGVPVKVWIPVRLSFVLPK